MDPTPPEPAEAEESAEAGEPVRAQERAAAAYLLRRRRRRRRRRKGMAVGCIVVAVLPVLGVGGLVAASAARERDAKSRAVAEADRAAETFVASVAGLDYTQGVPQDGLASAAAAGKVRLSEVRPGPGWTAEVRLRVERGYTSSPVPMRLTAKRCYRLVLGLPGPAPAVTGSDC
ncbi:hypothetical protein ACIRBX_09820 [Kitasatospora sp. NPDC096147]|uniref:hypothetical protein n=1 Tax=Kitasatospora sp. NPDC096147 TaxID=3364093 RepID=UPI00381E62AC